MPRPTMYDFTLPILKLLHDGKTHHSSAFVDHLAQYFNLTEAEVDERIPSGQRRLAKRVDWARWVLKEPTLV